MNNCYYFNPMHMDTKCIQFKSGEYLVMYDTFKRGELK